MMLNTKQVAEKLSVHQKTINRWINEGRIQATSFGRVFRISEEEVDYIIHNGLRDSKN